jgi:hypothetical protein
MQGNHLMTEKQAADIGWLFLILGELILITFKTIS